MALVVKNDLGKFAEKLKKFQTQGLADKVVDIVTKKGVEIAQSKWGGSASVREEGSGLQRSIVATDNNPTHPTIAYQEFGTGVNGRGTYEGKLPEQDITFDASGLGEVTTKGWQYNYRKDYLKVEGAKDFSGFAARMPMFNTAKELREYIKTDLANDIKKES